MDNKNNNVIITMCLGEREFINYTKPYMIEYSKKTDSDLVIVDDNNIKDYDFFSNSILTDIVTGRHNNKSYLYKMLLVMYYSERYQKILWIDDTCFIKTSCANLFDMIEDSCVMAYNEGENKDLKSWKDNQAYIKKLTGFSIDTNKYINSGVVLYTRSINKILNIEMLIKHSNLFNSAYPHQCFLNFIIQYYNIKLKLIDSSYNQIFMNCSYTNGRNISPDMIGDDFIVSRKNSIFHITGFYKNRLAIVKYISKTLSIDE